MTHLAAKANRDNREPAWVTAPPRKRQSDYTKPFMTLDMKPKPSIVARLFGGKAI